MCDSHVSGCQLLAWTESNAQAMTVPRQSRLHMAVLCDILIIIITDEVKGAHLPEYGNGYQDKEKMKL